MQSADFYAALDFARAHPTEHSDWHSARVAIGRPDELGDPADRARLREILAGFGPWRKGPFDVFGEAIDANWRCDLKWARIQKFAAPLAGRDICDVGTGNGYYLFRMGAHHPASVLGLDPTTAFAQCFEFLYTLQPRAANLKFVAEGFDHLRAAEYERRFDTIFCLGIVYHHTDPIALLRLLHRCLRPGGELVVESLGLPAALAVPGGGEAADLPLALTPAKGRYAGGGGNWHVPNSVCLAMWLRRAGFRDIVARGEYDFRDEQVRTAELPGLADALNPQNPSLTREGYPTPVRIYFSARR